MIVDNIMYNVKSICRVTQDIILVPFQRRYSASIGRSLTLYALHVRVTVDDTPLLLVSLTIDTAGSRCLLKTTRYGMKEATYGVRKATAKFQ
jgi:hypothetical protein